jgi:hypothetical protein
MEFAHGGSSNRTAVKSEQGASYESVVVGDHRPDYRRRGRSPGLYQRCRRRSLLFGIFLIIAIVIFLLILLGFGAVDAVT